VELRYASTVRVTHETCMQLFLILRLWRTTGRAYSANLVLRGITSHRREELVAVVSVVGKDTKTSFESH
jgi:hypothetical protein